MNPFEAREVWPPGTVVERKYVIDSTLGRGSFGTAYRAHHRVLARTYVIKRLHSQFAEDPAYVQKFVQEARAIERLSACPQIVQIFDMTQTEDGQLILVMENMAGGDLEGLIRTSAPFRVEDAVWYGLQIAEALNAAHTAGLIHRDVKPENVLLGADPKEAKLTDFGIVADQGTSSPTSVIRGGSVGYAAPEQWQVTGKFLDGRADLYALGVTLYRMLSGRMPYGETEIGTWLDRVRNSPYTPLRTMRSDVPEQLERLVGDLMAVDRERRPASVAPVIERLRALNPSRRPSPTLPEEHRKTEELAQIVPTPGPIPVPSPQPPFPLNPQPAPPPPYYYQAPSPIPGPYPPTPLPLPPPPPIPAPPPPRRFGWFLLGFLIAGLGVGGWWFYEHRPPKVNPKDGLTYLWIKPGKFTMGCPTANTDCRDEEKPAHEVTLTKGFYLSRTEVTVDAYQKFSGATRTPMPVEPRWGTFEMNPGWRSRNSPISLVTWKQAASYCDWIGGRLPTEAEWEYAARAGSTGLRYGDLNEIGWYADNAGTYRVDSLDLVKQDSKNYEDRLMNNQNTFHPAGLKPPNAFGLHDMIGNVWEWVADWYDDKYYSKSAGEDPAGPREGQRRIARGGSYFINPKRATATARSSQEPAYFNAGVGFRCAWDAPIF